MSSVGRREPDQAKLEKNRLRRVETSFGRYRTWTLRPLRRCTFATAIQTL